jgi:hypothetical protein
MAAKAKKIDEKVEVVEVEQVIKLVAPDGIETRYELVDSFMIPVLKSSGWKEV